MSADSIRLRILLLIFAGWISRHQQDVIEYLIEENWVLEEQLRGHRLRLYWSSDLRSTSSCSQTAR